MPICSLYRSEQEVRIQLHLDQDPQRKKGSRGLVKTKSTQHWTQLT
jgi:hypothetical protein